MALRRGSWGWAVRPDWRGGGRWRPLPSSLWPWGVWNVLSRAWTVAEGGLEAAGIQGQDAEAEVRERKAKAALMGQLSGT